jgi:starvation-inducible DNA-binding protein
MEDNDLIVEMKKLLASTFSFYLKAHGFHWNVMGSNFPQYHDFLGDVYEMAHGEVDDIAEQIRQLGSFSPASYDRFSSLTLVADELGIPEPLDMMIKLRSDNQTLMGQIGLCNKMAEDSNKIGLANFLQDLMMHHSKLGWKLSSIVGLQQV